MKKIKRILWLLVIFRWVVELLGKVPFVVKSCNAFLASKLGARLTIHMLSEPFRTISDIWDIYYSSFRLAVPIGLVIVCLTVKIIRSNTLYRCILWLKKNFHTPHSTPRLNRTYVRYISRGVEGVIDIQKLRHFCLEGVQLDYENNTDSAIASFEGHRQKLSSRWTEVNGVSLCVAKYQESSMSSPSKALT